MKTPPLAISFHKHKQRLICKWLYLLL